MPSHGKKGNGGRKAVVPKERPKTRKELRKDKRLQKKANRVHFHKRKKELKIEYRARLKEQKMGNSNRGGVQKNTAVATMDEASEVEDNDGGGSDDEDDEIDSDFELSDEEMEAKFSGKSKNANKISTPVNLLEQNLQQTKQKQKQLEKEMRKQRVRQLKMANEDEDKVIRRLEKQLKIDKSRSEKYVPKMFNDGLDYALELCLPENIEKMYTAAKEAAAAEDQLSDDDFQEDLDLATAKTNKPTKKQAAEEKKIATEKRVQHNEKKDLQKMAKLRQIESKYFDTDDELASDLSGIDSEFENDDMNSDAESEDSDQDDDDMPDEVPIGKNSKNKKTAEKSKKTYKIAESSESEQDPESDEDVESDEVGESDEDNISDESMEDDLDNLTRDTDSMEEGPDEDEKEENSKMWQDIYGRSRDKEGNVITAAENTESKYVPPHVRARLAAASSDDPKRTEKLLRLRRQLKGFLNRLSETNMHKITADIDALYMQNSRFDMNTTLTSLCLEALVSNVLAPERMVLEHALLIATLHANVGSEVGAHFLQTLIEKFDKLMNGIRETAVENKELDNVVFVICHLYTFKIFQHNLIYEILHKLVEELSEKSMECVLLTLRSIGFALRRDDPIALKDFILVVQKKSNVALENIKNDFRLKYMFDVLLAIKNNNVNKIPQYDPTLAEHLRKVLKSMLVNGKYVTTLNITLDDLLKADQRGKWWVVGSAWTGNVNDIGNAAASKPTGGGKEVTRYSEQILELAKKQRMNTDDRRNCFCVLMTAEDYIDAFEKLLQLAIKDHRVVITVIIHCALSEKVFNPYYSILIQKFGEYDRKYQLAVQFAIWDRIKDLKSHTNIQIRNLAQLLIHQIELGAQALSVLKIVEFAELDKITLRLVRQIVLGLLLGKEETCKEVFGRIAPSAKLKSFKESLRLFMHHFLIKGGTKSGVAEDKMDLLVKRVNLADKALETNDSRLKF